MAKLLIPLGIIVGLISALILVQNLRSIGKPKTSQQEEKQVQQDFQQEENKEGKQKTSFSFAPSDPYLSTKESPYSSPEKDFQPNRSTASGYVETARDGVALVRSSPQQLEYVATDTGRPIRKTAQFLGHTTPPMIVQVDCEEAQIRGVMGKGLWENKDVGYGVVISASPTLIKIRRYSDDGLTLITPTPKQPTLASQEKDSSPLTPEPPPEPSLLPTTPFSPPSANAPKNPRDGR